MQHAVGNDRRSSVTVHCLDICVARTYAETWIFLGSDLSGAVDRRRDQLARIVRAALTQGFLVTFAGSLFCYVEGSPRS
jgi:hypothetical protein